MAELPALLDEMDVNIIRTLQRDARTNFADMAKEFGVSIDTVLNRFKKLKESGVVRGTTIFLSLKSLGYDCVASLEIDVDYPTVSDVIDLIKTKEGVIFCTPSMGRSDIFAIAILKNVDRLSRLIESIKRHPMVRGIAASIWVDELLLCPENFEFDQVMRGDGDG